MIKPTIHVGDALPHGSGAPSPLTKEFLQRHNDTVAMHRQVAEQGYNEWTVINPLPWKLSINLGDAGYVNVPPCEEGAPYRRHVLDGYRISQADKGGSTFVPTLIVPAQIAKEFERKYFNKGVFIYEGSEKVPPAALLTLALDRRIRYFREQYAQGRDNWAKSRSMRHISSTMRFAAKELIRLGEIAQIPEWCETTRTPDNICEACGAIRNINAKFCVNGTCQFPFDQLWVMKHRKDIAKMYGLFDEQAPMPSAPVVSAPVATTEPTGDEPQAPTQPRRGSR